MMKDLFIDNNIASRFTNPVDLEYKKLIKWLLKFDKDNPSDNAYLVVSNKLIKEYFSSARGASSGTSIPVIIDTLTRQGRLISITNEQIKEFQREYFTKTVERKLKSNKEDRDHIPVVLLSHRKYALAIDKNFVDDLENFPGFVVRVEKRPELLPYE